VFGRETIIGNDVWIGAHVCVKQGVSIGDGAVVGAGSVVTHDIPPYSIAYGIPAKVIKKRFENEEKEKLIKESGFWELEPEEAKQILVKIEYMEYDNNNHTNL
jgi:serine acetyltransferase